MWMEAGGGGSSVKPFAGISCRFAGRGAGRDKEQLFVTEGKGWDREQGGLKVRRSHRPGLRWFPPSQMAAHPAKPPPTKGRV